MAHKHNPVAAICARAAAMQVPGLVATLLHAAGSHEFERAAGAWHAEWPALNALLRARLGGRLACTSLVHRRRRPRPDGRQPGPQRRSATMTDLARVDTGAPDGPTDRLARVARQLDGDVGPPSGRASPPRIAASSSTIPVTVASPPDAWTAVDRRLGADVLAALDRIGVARAHVVGLSLGAMVAMWWPPTTRSGSIVWRCCARAPASSHLGRGTSGRRRCAPVERAPSPRPSSALAVAGVRRAPSRRGRRVRGDDQLRPTPRATPAVARRSRRWTCCRRSPTITARTLVVAGTLDPATPPRTRRGDRRRHPRQPARARLDAAHLANWERADEVNRLLAAHLDGRDDG